MNVWGIKHWRSYWSLIIRPERRWDNHMSSSLHYVCVQEKVQAHVQTHLANLWTFAHFPVSVCMYSFLSYAWMCVVLCMSPCIHVCHHVHTFVFATHLLVLDSVPVRAPCQNKRLRPGESDMWTICLCALGADLCVFVCLCVQSCVFLDICVCVCKPRHSLSPGPNLGLNKGDIKFLSPPHICVSAPMAVIETVGIVCAPFSWEWRGCACVHTCMWWHVTQSSISNGGV